MLAAKEQFIFNDKGSKIGVFLTIDQYNLILEALEELEDIKDFDSFQAGYEEALDFGGAIAEIENLRGNL